MKMYICDLYFRTISDIKMHLLPLAMAIIPDLKTYNHLLLLYYENNF